MPNYGKMTTRELDFAAKPESIKSDIGRISSSGSTSWSRLKDPRIVRVSRAFGGKDRHSKVCTVKGLRDRRVRLSVSTAIQLYDLQDRLGLNQPSKVVDWLLNAAKHEIDELPPLQIPPGSNFSHPLLNSHEFIRPLQSDKEFLKISRDIDWNEPLKQSQSTDLWGDKSKDVLGGTTMERSDEDEKLCNLEGQEAYVSSNNLFPRPNQSSVPGLLNNAMQYNSNFLRWDPSNLSLRSAGLPAQPEDFHNFNVLEPLPSSAVSVPSGSQQVLVYQPRMTQSYFPSPQEFDQKQVNFQMMNPSSQLSNSPVHSTAESVRHFNFSMTASLLPSQNSNGGKKPNKHEEFNDSV